MTNENTSDAKFHVQKMKQRFEENVDHLRRDIKIIDDPQCKAIFETAAEVLLGLIKTLDDYNKKEEDAWK